MVTLGDGGVGMLGVLEDSGSAGPPDTGPCGVGVGVGVGGVTCDVTLVGVGADVEVTGAGGAVGLIEVTAMLSIGWLAVLQLATNAEKASVM
jgi:hypothetical protein